MGVADLKQIYRLSLYLYPRRFRREFGEEMEEIFASLVDEARQKGSLELMRLQLREFGDLPYNAIREHLSPWLRGTVHYFSRHPVLAGMAGYGFGYGLTRLPLAIKDPYPFFSFFYTDLGMYLLIFLAGCIGGSLLGLSIRRGGSRWFGLLGGLSQLASYILVNIVWFRLFPGHNSLPVEGALGLLIILLHPLLNGLLIGGILGSVGENWKYILRFSGFSVAGFVTGFLADRLVAALIESYLLNPAYNPLPAWTGVWEGVYLVIPYLIFGAVIGISLGLANRKPRLLKTRLAI
jgi:hypothetical protein